MKSLLTSWRPPLAQIETAQHCKAVAQTIFRAEVNPSCAPSTGRMRVVHRGLAESMKCYERKPLLLCSKDVFTWKFSSASKTKMTNSLIILRGEKTD